MASPYPPTSGVPPPYTAGDPYSKQGRPPPGFQGAPPPAAGYGAPPPLAPGYGAPPPLAHGYGAPGYGAPPPAPGYGAPAPVMAQPTVVQQIATPVVVVAGNTCPACRAGILASEFTFCGIFWAICYFPLGLICCFMMQERRCSNCRITYR